MRSFQVPLRHNFKLSGIPAWQRKPKSASTTPSLVSKSTKGRKSWSGRFMGNQCHPTTCPARFRIQHNFKPIDQRPLSRFLVPICCAERPARSGKQQTQSEKLSMTLSKLGCPNNWSARASCRRSCRCKAVRSGNPPNNPSQSRLSHR